MSHPDDNTHEKVESTAKSVDHLTERVDAMDKDVGAVKVDVDEMKSDVSEMKAMMQKHTEAQVVFSSMVSDKIERLLIASASNTMAVKMLIGVFTIIFGASLATLFRMLS